MPSKRTASVIIICFAIVISIWLLMERRSQNLTVESSASIEVVDINSFAKTTEEWQNVLNVIDQKNQKVEDLTNQQEIEFSDSNSLTDQMAKDLFSKFLLLSKGNQELTEEDIMVMVSSLALSPDIKTTPEITYTLKDINIADNSSASTILNYKNEFNGHLFNRMMQTKNEADPLTALSDALATGKDTAQVKLDDTVIALRDFINDMLKIRVPKNASKMHLDALNSINQLLFDIESIKNVFKDPARTLIVMENFNNHVNEFISSLKKLDSYFPK